MLIINLKIHLNPEKNSAINGRMVAVHFSKIIKISEFVAIKNAAWVNQNAKLIYKVQKFSAAAPCHYLKIFQIISRFKKQTP